MNIGNLQGLHGLQHLVTNKDSLKHLLPNTESTRFYEESTKVRVRKSVELLAKHLQLKRGYLGVELL